MRKSVLALCVLVGCASAPVDDQDPQLTPDEVAQLPDDVLDHQGLDLVLAAEVPQDDAATFDNVDVMETVDIPGDDTTASDAYVAYAALLKWGLHPRASDALRAAGVQSWRIMQTIGNATASAGTHAQDGVFNGHPYSAATDISVSGLSNTQIRNLLERLSRVGFAAWYREPGHDGWPSYEIRHIHAVYANAKMKLSLRSQIRSWLVGRNGLVSNTLYGFYHWTTTGKDVVRHKFAQSDSGTTNAGSTCFAGGYYCGGDKISGDHSTLYRCTGTGAPALVRHCANGCSVNAGRDDSCR